MAENCSSFDCPHPDLLCDEETNDLCFDDPLLHLQPSDHQSTGGLESQEMLLTDESLVWMVEREKEHLPRNDYLNRLRTGDLDLSLRKEALDWIFKACSHHNFGELCLYLAISYLDRFISVYALPRGKEWAVHLVAVACLSLAAKIDEVNVPSTVDLQVETKYLFEGKTVQRMEVLVMNYLKWNLKAYTPLNFVDYFLKKVNCDHVSQGNLIRRSTQIFLCTIKGIDFLEFKPSEIAAAVAVYVSGEIQAIDIDKALSSFILVEKERVANCLQLIRDLISISGTSISAAAATTTTTTTATVPCSPNGVLDAAVFSYKNVERANGTCPNTTPHSTKRRKLDHTTK